jgi:hypothetical protein
MVLYASYVCLLHSHFDENHPIWILKDGPLNYEVVLSQDSLKIVSNWLVILLGSVPGSALARAGVMSIGCCLIGNCGGVS